MTADERDTIRSALQHWGAYAHEGEANAIMHVYDDLTYEAQSFAGVPALRISRVPDIVDRQSEPWALWPWVARLGSRWARGDSPADAVSRLLF